MPDFNKLKEEIDYKWKIQGYNKKKTKANIVAYIDSRCASSALDEACGPDGWQDEYKLIGKDLVCGVSIKCGDEWVTKWDIGTPSDFEKEKGLYSDAFKRACVKWGVGKFLYDKEMVVLDVKEQKGFHNVVDSNGNKIWNIDEHVKKMQSKPKQQYTPPKKTPPKKTPQKKQDNGLKEATLKDIEKLNNLANNGKTKEIGIMKETIKFDDKVNQHALNLYNEWNEKQKGNK